MTTLAMAGLGVALSLASWAMLIFRKQKQIEESSRLSSLQQATKLMYLWSEFEFTAKEKLKTRNIDFAKHSIRSVISTLYEHKLISKKDMVLLEDVMQLRNSIAHSRMGDDISLDLVEEMSKILKESIHKLSEN